MTMRTIFSQGIPLERKVFGMKKVKTFRTRLLAIVIVLTLAVSLAGCGENKSVEESPTNRPPADSEDQVVDEVQIPDTAIEGTFRTEQTPPAGLGTELTFTADGTVTDNTGDGAGTYKIDGDKLTITYQGIVMPYSFSNGGDNIALDGVDYFIIDGEEVESVPPGDPNAAWYGLILHLDGLDEWSPNFNVPRSAVIDESVYTDYVRDNLTYLIDVRDVLQSSEIRQYLDAPVRVESPEFNFHQLYVYDRAGLVFEFGGNSFYVNPDGSEISHGGVVHGQLGDVYYSPTLGRVLTYGEVFEDKEITFNEFFKRYPDYKKYGTE
jgi:predicted small lipoprotein YifL